MPRLGLTKNGNQIHLKNIDKIRKIRELMLKSQIISNETSMPIENKKGAQNLPNPLLKKTRFS